MPKPKGKDKVKVSAVIAAGEHERLTKLAERGETTVGIIVGTAVLTFLEGLEAHPRRIKQLPKDGRRAN